MPRGSYVLPLRLSRVVRAKTSALRHPASGLLMGETCALGLSIHSYADMQPGDRIQTFCNDREGPTCVVLPEHLTDHPVQVVFSKEWLLSLNNDFVMISYQVVDRAGNTSQMARSVTLSMQV